MNTDDVLLCLWCDEPLRGEGRTIYCSCGVAYAKVILDRAQRDEWESIRRRDARWLVRRNDDELVITDLVAVWEANP